MPKAYPIDTMGTHSTNKTFDARSYLARHKPSSSRTRMAVLRQLCKRSWFAASDQTVQDTLAALPQTGVENHDGFLRNLASRPELVGEIRTLRMLDCPRGYYYLCPIFEVQNIHSKHTYTYEFFALRYGVPAGAKGFVLVKPDASAEPTEIIILTALKFTIGRWQDDLMGGAPDVTVDGNDPKTIHVNTAIREIQEETGVRDLVIDPDNVHFMGDHSLDSGITSNEIGFFVAYLDAKQADRISSHGQNIDDYEMNTRIKRIPINQLHKLLEATDNSMLLACAMKAVTHGHIPIARVMKDS